MIHRCSLTANLSPSSRAALRHMPTMSFLRPYVGGVPRLVLRIPHVEVIVMHAHAHEIFCAGFLVQAHELGGVKLFGFPKRNGVFVAKFGRMAVGFAVIKVLLGLLPCTCCGHTNRRLQWPTADPNAPRCRTWHHETTREFRNRSKIRASLEKDLFRFPSRAGTRAEALVVEIDTLRAGNALASNPIACLRFIFIRVLLLYRLRRKLEIRHPP